MSRRKNRPLLPWLSAKADGKEERFIQKGNSLVFSKAYQELSAGAKVTYDAMAFESGGKRQFKFSASCMKKYGFNRSSCQKHIIELEEKHFIKCVYRGKAQMNSNEYEFCLEWKRQQL